MTEFDDGTDRTGDSDHGSADRAERAFRDALTGLAVHTEVDPAAARARAGRRRATGLSALGVVALVLAVVGLVLVPRWVTEPPHDIARPAGPAATGFSDPAPQGWRTEQYRGVTFEVPAAWGYAFEPGPDWCAGRDENGGGPMPPLDPYVSLGGPSTILLLACPDLPARLVTEHVATTVIDPGFYGPGQSTGRVNGLWVEVRTLEGVAIRAVAAKRDLARQIVASARPTTDADACRPTTDSTRRPAPAFTPGAASVTGSGVLCQYDPGDEYDHDTVARLRARTTISAVDLRRLLGLVAGAATGTNACADTIVGPSTELLVLVLVPTADGERTLQLRVGGCGDEGGTLFGGFDDGRRVHRVVRASCDLVMHEPVQFTAGSEDLFRACGPR